MDCKVCGAKDIRPSMGGIDICGACDCGGMFEMGGKKYLDMDYLSAYGYVKLSDVELDEERIEEVLRSHQEGLELHIATQQGFNKLAHAITQAKDIFKIK